MSKRSSHFDGRFARREETEKRIQQGRRAELKLQQLSSLTGESFEEFVAELFEMLDFEVEKVGGSGDNGVDLRLTAATDCLQSFSASITSKAWSARPSFRGSWERFTTPSSQQGFFVTTSTFTLSAEKFAAENPIELLDGPRLVELVNRAMGPKPKHGDEPLLF